MKGWHLAVLQCWVPLAFHYCFQTHPPRRRMHHSSPRLRGLKQPLVGRLLSYFQCHQLQLRGLLPRTGPHKIGNVSKGVEPHTWLVHACYFRLQLLLSGWMAAGFSWHLLVWSARWCELLKFVSCCHLQYLVSVQKASECHLLLLLSLKLYLLPDYVSHR